MRVGPRGYDPFWGDDPLRYVEPARIEWGKPKKAAASEEDDAQFFGNVLKTNKPIITDTGLYKRIDFKV